MKLEDSLMGVDVQMPRKQLHKVADNANGLEAYNLVEAAVVALIALDHNQDHVYLHATGHPLDQLEHL